MTDDEDIINSIIPSLKSAVTWSNSNIHQKMETALRYYKREPLPGDSVLKGKSKWVSPKIQQQQDWLEAQILRIFSSPENVVEFCGIGPEDEAIARQQTQVVNWVLKVENNYGTILKSWLQTGLLTGLSVVTAEFGFHNEESLPRMLKGVPNEMLVALNEQEEAGQIIIEEVGKPQTIPGPMGPIETRDLKIRTIKRIPRFQILPVAPEDFIVSKDAKPDPETGGIAARIQGHRKILSRADLIEMGFDRDKVEQLPAASDSTSGIALERASEMSGEQGVDSKTDVEVFSIYTKLKVGKDTKARHYRLTIGGDLENRPVLLDYAEVSRYYPYCPFTPFPISNTLFSLGVPDRLADDFQLHTRLYRNVLDNLSQHVQPRTIVNPDSTNVEDLLNNHAGAVIRSTDPTGGVSFQSVPFVGADAIPVIDQLSQSAEFSTGVGPTMSGLNGEDFSRVSATASNLRSNASQLLIEMISRHFADGGYRYLCAVVVDLLIQKPDEAAELMTRLTNQAIPLDEFSTDFDLATSVAFGVMSRDQSQAQLTNLLAQQYQAIQAGLPIVNAQGIYATLQKIVEGQGLKNTAPFLVDPSTLPPAPPPQPPPPSEAEIMAQAERLKAELKSQADSADREFKMRQFIAEMDLKRDQMAQDREIKIAEIQARYGAEVEKQRLILEQSAPRDPMGAIIQ